MRHRVKGWTLAADHANSGQLRHVAEEPASGQSIAARLRARRLQLKISQARVAELAGLSRENYNHYERGRRVPRGANRERLETALQLQPGTLEPVPPERDDPRTERLLRELLEVTQQNNRLLGLLVARLAGQEGQADPEEDERVPQQGQTTVPSGAGG